MFDETLPFDTFEDEEELLTPQLSADISADLTASIETQIANRPTDTMGVSPSLIRNMPAADFRRWRSNEQIYNLPEGSPIRDYISDPSNLAVSQNEIGTLQKIADSAQDMVDFLHHLPSLMSMGAEKARSGGEQTRATVKGMYGRDDIRSSEEVEAEIQERLEYIQRTGTTTIGPVPEAQRFFDPVAQSRSDADRRKFIEQDTILRQLRSELDRAHEYESLSESEQQAYQQSHMHDAKRLRIGSRANEEALNLLGYRDSLARRFVADTSYLFAQQWDRLRRGETGVAAVAGTLAGVAGGAVLTAFPATAPWGAKVLTALGAKVHLSPFAAAVTTGLASGYRFGSMADTYQAYSAQTFLELYDTKDLNGEPLDHDVMLRASEFAGLAAALLDGSIGHVSRRFLYQVTPMSEAKREMGRAAIMSGLRATLINQSKRTAFMNATKNLASAATLGGLNEIMQEAIVIMSGDAAKSYSESKGMNYFLEPTGLKAWFNLWTPEAQTRYQEAFTTMALGSLGMGLPSASISVASAVGQAQEAQAFAADIGRTHSELHTKAPETAASPAHAEKALNVMGFNQTVYIAGQDLAEIVQAHPEVQEVLGLSESDMNVVESGEPIQFSLSEIMAKIKPGEAFERVKNSIMASKEAMSGNEAKEARSNLDKIMENYISISNEIHNEMSDFNTRMEEVRQQVDEIVKSLRDQGVALGNEYAHDVSQIIESFGIRMALTEGVNPTDFLNRLDIQNMTDQIGRMQTGVTPEVLGNVFKVNVKTSDDVTMTDFVVGNFKTSERHPANRIEAAKQIAQELLNRTPVEGENMAALGAMYVLEPSAITDPEIRQIVADWMNPHLREAGLTGGFAQQVFVSPPVGMTNPRIFKSRSGAWQVNYDSPYGGGYRRFESRGQAERFARGETIPFLEPLKGAEIKITDDPKPAPQFEEWTERATGEEILDKPMRGYHFGLEGDKLSKVETAFYREFPAGRNYHEDGIVVEFPTGTKVTYFGDDEFRATPDSETKAWRLKRGWLRGVEPSEGFAQNQQAQLSGKMTPMPDHRYLVEVFQNADASTIFHELGHVFLSEMDYIKEQGIMSDKLQRDYEALNNWLNKGQKPEGMSDVVYRQERFARGFEAYLRDGTPPSTELEGAFTRIKEWMKSVYNAMKNLAEAAGFDVKLTSEVRMIFDRMLATDAQIEHFAMQSDFVLTPQNLEQLNATEEQKSQIRRTLKAAMDNAKSQVEYEKMRWAKERNAAWKKEAEALIKNSKEFQDREYFRDNKVDYNMLVELVGKERAAEFARRGNLAKKDTNYNPQQAAADRGYESVDNMINAQLDTPSEANFIKEHMMQRQEDYEASNISIEEQVIAQNKMQDYLQSVGKILANQLGIGQRAKTARALKQWAAAQLGGSTVNEAVAVDSLTRSFQYHMKRFQNYMKGTRPDKFIKAYESLEKARQYAAKAQEAKALRDEINKAVRKAKKYLTTKDKPAIEFGKHVRSLLHRMGLSKKKVDGELTPMSTLMADLNDNSMVPLAFPSVDQSILDKLTGNFRKDLTSNEARQVFAFMDWAQKYGIKIQEGQLSHMEGKLDDWIPRFMKPLTEMPDAGKPAEEGTSLRSWQKKIERIKAHLTLPQTLMRMLDGFKHGIHVKELWGGIDKAVNRVGLRLDDIVQQIRPISDHINQRAAELPKFINTSNTDSVIDGVRVSMPEVPGLLQNDTQQWTFEKIFVIGLNQGTAYNRQAILDGYGMTQNEVDRLLTVLNDTDWQMIERTREIVNNQWDSLAKAYEAMNMVKPIKVQGDDYTNSITGKTHSGGYYPIRFDPNLSYRVDQNAKVDDLMSSVVSAFMNPKVPQGFTIERKGTGALPVSLSLKELATHLAHTTTYAEMAPILSDLDRITKDKNYRSEVTRVFGKELFDQIRPLLQKVANGDGDTIHKATQAAMGNLRSMVTASALVGRATVAVKQPLSYIPFLRKYGAGKALRGYMDFLSQPREAYQTAVELSHLMRHRFEFIDETVGELMRVGLEKATPVETVSKFIARVAGSTIGIMDAIVSYPIWWTAFQDAQRDGMSVEDAATHANTWVSETNPSTRVMDRSYFMSQKATVYAMFNLFSGWIQKHQNEVMFNYMGYQRNQINTKELLTFAMTDMVLGAIGGTILVSALRGRTPEREELITDMISYNTAGLPIVGEIVTAAARRAAGLRSYRVGDSPVTMVAEMALKVPVDFFTAASEGDAKSMAWAIAEGLSFTYKIPATRIYEDLMEGWRQAQQQKWPTLLISPDPELRRR